MSNLHFFYGTMSASKSTKLLTDRYNFIQKGIDVFVLKPSIDRTTEPIITSRIGIQCPAIIRNNRKMILINFLSSKFSKFYSFKTYDF